MDLWAITLLTFSLCWLAFSDAREGTVYKFWTESVNIKKCKNAELISYADQFLSKNCDISYEDANLILKRTLCHATLLAAGLVCSDPSVAENNHQIDPYSWDSNLPISEICGNEGLIRYSNVNLFDSSSSRDVNENLQKILGDCSHICKESVDMLKACSTFINFCRVAFEEDRSNSNVANPAFDYGGNAVKDEDPKPQAQQQLSEQDQVPLNEDLKAGPVEEKIDSAEKLTKTESHITEVKEAETVPAKSIMANSDANANDKDKKAAVDRAFFNANKSGKLSGDIVEPSSDVKFPIVGNGSDKRKLGDFYTPTFYTADGESSSFSEYVPWFLLIGLVIVILYALTLKKNRVIACIVEGKRPKRGNRATNAFHHNSEDKMNGEARHFRVDLDSSDGEEANTFNDAAPMLKNF